MPLYIEGDTIKRVTFDRPACEAPLKNNWLKDIISFVLSIVR